MSLSRLAFSRQNLSDLCTSDHSSRPDFTSVLYSSNELADSERRVSAAPAGCETDGAPRHTQHIQVRGSPVRNQLSRKRTFYETRQAHQETNFLRDQVRHHLLDPTSGTPHGPDSSRPAVARRTPRPKSATRPAALCSPVPRGGSPEVLHAGGEVVGEEARVRHQVLVAVVALADELQVTQYLALYHLDRVLALHARVQHLLDQVLPESSASLRRVSTLQWWLNGYLKSTIRIILWRRPQLHNTLSLT